MKTITVCLVGIIAIAIAIIGTATIFTIGIMDHDREVTKQLRIQHSCSE